MKHAKVATVAVAASAMVVLGVAVTGTAHAGTNGQQLRVCVTGGDYRRILANGPDQDGQEQGTVSEISPEGCASIPGRRWKGQVRIAATGSQSLADAISSCDVPATQEGDIFECRIQPGPPQGDDVGGCGVPTSLQTAMRTSVYWSFSLVARTLTKYYINPALVPHLIC